MAELKFNSIIEGDSIEVGASGQCIGCLRLWGNGWHYQPGTLPRDYSADELEQIAAKLRELNGEPNTRALDERVKELREWLPSQEWIANGTVVISAGNIEGKINELFPELRLFLPAKGEVGNERIEK